MALTDVCIMLDLDIKTIVMDDMTVGDADVLELFDTLGDNDEQA